MTDESVQPKNLEAFKTALKADVVIPGATRAGGLRAGEVMATGEWFKGRKVGGQLWAYHVTAKAALPGIARRGLVPSQEDGLLFFTDAEHVDDTYGDVLLRFPYPTDAWNVEEGNNLIDHAIETEKIEVFTEDGWQGLDGQLNRNQKLAEQTLRIIHYQLNVLMVSANDQQLGQVVVFCQEQLRDKGVGVLRIRGQDIHRANDFVLAVGRGMGFPEEEIAGEYFYEKIAQLRFALEEKYPGWERPVVIVEGLAPETVHTIFGRLRDEVWALPLVWLVAGETKYKAGYLTPPADSFFAKVIELDASQREL